MGRKKLTEEEKSIFRANLLDAALTLFAEEGYKAVSIRALADKIGCSAMTPYRYFKNKAAIFDACRRRCFEQFADAQEATAARTSEPIARIGALGAAYAKFAKKNPHAFRLMFEQANPNEASDVLLATEHRAFATLRNAVAEAVDAGKLQGNAETLAHLYWASIHGVVVLDLAEKLVHGRSKRTLLASLLGGEFNAARTSSNAKH